MKTTTKNTIITRIDLTTEERAILNKAEGIINEFLRELSQATAYELQEMPEHNVFLPNDFKDIATILNLDGKAFTLEE